MAVISLLRGLALLLLVTTVTAGSYGNVGGPIAKSPRKKPSSKTKTTQFPDVDEGVEEPSFKAPESKINAEVIKQPNKTAPAVDEKPQFFAPNPGEYGDLCCWEPYQNLLLNDIAQGKAVRPFYGFAGIEQCTDPASCLQKCSQQKCNLAIYNSSNKSAAFFVAHKDKLENLAPSTNFQKQDGTDTLVRRCLREYDITPGCTELVASSCPLCDEFLAFVTKYKRTYKGCEFIRRFEIFKMNKLKIASLNEKRILDDDATFTVTRFTDRTHDEFVKLFTGAKEDKGVNVVGENVVKDKFVNSTGLEELSLRFDWRDKSVIPEVRDQGECGSCYAFTSTDMIAAQFLVDRKQFGKSFTLAPQYILDCFKEPAAYGCDGGRPVMVMKALSKCDKGNGGNNSAGCEFPLETCLPYRDDAQQICDKPPSCPGAPSIKVERYGMVDLSNDFLEKQKIAGLLHRGPLVVQVDANDAWQFYESGIIRAHQCTSKVNHAVLMTGYDFGVAVPAYIIRNTWSDEWGQSGYVYLEAGVNACGVGQAVTYACTFNCSMMMTTTTPPPQPSSPPPVTTVPPPYGQPSIAPTTTTPAPPPPPYGAPPPSAGSPAPVPSPQPTAPQYTVPSEPAFPTKPPPAYAAPGSSVATAPAPSPASAADTTAATTVAALATDTTATTTAAPADPETTTEVLGSTVLFWANQRLQRDSVVPVDPLAAWKRNNARRGSSKKHRQA